MPTLGAMSNYLEHMVLNSALRGVAFSVPSTVYLALYASDPTDADTGTEVSSGGYARQVVDFSAPAQEGGKGTVENNAEIEFAVATANWGQITHMGVRDAATGGNLLFHGELNSPKIIAEGDQFRVLAGHLKIDLD